MFKKMDSPDQKVTAETEKTATTSKGFFQKASDFIARHVQRGERLLEMEKLEQEYELDEYMGQYQEAFEHEADFQKAKSKVMDRLIDEYMPTIPDKSRFTFKAEYLEQIIDNLFEEELKHYEKSKRLKDLFEINKKQ